MNTARNLVLALVSAVLLLAGCSSAENAQQSSPAEPAEATIRITGDRVPAPADRINAAQGQTVRLTAVSDHADEVHVDGHDKAVAVRRHERAAVEFQADDPGVLGGELDESKAERPSLEVG